jgi:hypothetical protein
MTMKRNKPVTLRVNVTKLSIEKGVPGEAESCPISLALQRLHGVSSVLVGTSHANFKFKGKPKCIALPDEAVKFIYIFDAHHGRGVAPFKFNLKLL